LTIYADSSFLVSLYVPSSHSARAQRLLLPHARVWLTPLHRAEWAHVLAQHILQKRISPAQAQAFNTSFERDRQSRVLSEVGLPEKTFERCIQIVQQHSGRVPMATLDTLHVACALELGAERFWTFDERQAKLARAVGLKI
jgi:predicted nucleic acid-binding protein